MNTRQILIWIKNNLVPSINQAIAQSQKPDTILIYTTDWLVGITARETGDLINRYASANTKPEIMHTLMRGDYSQRPGETEKSYHGYGYTQIDIASFPDFVKSGDWKIPLKLYLKTIEILEEKRLYIEKHFQKLGGDQLNRAITASYNCGEGNIVKVLSEGKDIDAFTTDHNYSADVWQKRNFYKQIIAELN